MSVIGDLINRIMDSLFGRNDFLRLQSANRDFNLETKLNFSNIQAFDDPTNYNEYCQKYFRNFRNFQKQYNYVEIITEMQETGAMKDYQLYLQYVKDNPGLYCPFKINGVEHTSRVLLYSAMLCMLDDISSYFKNLIMVAAQLHDIGREDTLLDVDYGMDSVQKIEQYGLLRNFDNRDKDIIEFAIATHLLGPHQVKEELRSIPRKYRKDYKFVLDYLQDADKLDRTCGGNTGLELDPNKLGNETAKKLIKVAYQNYYEYEEMMKYENKCTNKKPFQDSFERILKQSYGKVVKSGYKITMEEFEQIISEFKPGTLELLRSQERILDIFSYQTFKKYRKPEISEDSLKSDRIEASRLYAEVTRKQQTSLLKSTFDKNYMLYYNLKKTNPEAFELLCYIDIDESVLGLVSIVKEIRLNHLDRFNSKGYNLRLNDLFSLALKVEPKEYKQIILSGKLEDLFSSKYEKNIEEKILVRQKLAEFGIVYEEKFFEDNYRFIQGIVNINPKVLKIPQINQYNIADVFVAVTKIRDTKNKVGEANSQQLDFNSKLIIDLINYSRNLNSGENILESTAEDIAENISDLEQINDNEKNEINYNSAEDPRFIEYTLKRNKPYTTTDISEILNYVEYCCDRILTDEHISLGTAKSKFLNAMFNMDIPIKYRENYEKEIIELLYYHKKYFPESNLEKTAGDTLDRIRKIFDTTTIVEFKNSLYEIKGEIDLYNTTLIAEEIKKEVTEFSKQDIVSKLQETAKEIEQMPTEQIVSTNGIVVDVKRFNGQDYKIALSTVMPKCVMHINKETEELDSIYEEMINQEVLSEEVSTCINSDEFVAHPASILQNQELNYGYVPNDVDDISISAVYDLSLMENKNGKRITEMPVTPRNVEDLLLGTREEHCEVIMNNVYPRYIFCYDEVTEIAINKRDLLEQEYNKKGINQPIEIVLIDSKTSYIPKIKAKIEQEHREIRQKLKYGVFTDADFENMFEKHESNFVLRTLQIMHNTSYRDDVWSEQYNLQLIDSLMDILKNITQTVSTNKIRFVLKQIEILLERADKTQQYGIRFYDHSYADAIDIEELNKMKNILLPKVISYEKGLTTGIQTYENTQNNSNGTETNNYRYQNAYSYS